MAHLIDLYHSGSDRGYRDGYEGRRRRAEWELRLITTPWTWFPGTDSDTYVQGYRDGFKAGCDMRNGLQRIGFL